MRSLRIRLLLIVSVALAPALALQAWIERDADRVRQQLAEAEALRLVRLVADQQQRIAEGAEQALAAIASANSVQNRKAEACAPLLARLLALEPRYNSASVLGLDGQVICAGRPAEAGVNAADRPFFRLALQTGGFVIGDYTVGRISGRPALHVARPFRDPEGQVAGVVVLALNIDWLGRQLDALGLPPETTVSVSDRNGIVIARHPDGPRYIGRPEGAAAPVLPPEGGIGLVTLAGPDGRARVVATSPPGGPPDGLRIGVALDREAAFAAVTQANRSGVLLILLGAALGLTATALLGGRLIGRPVARLLAASRQWRAGDLAARTGLRHDRSEFGRLGAGFDAMAEALAARERDLRATEAELRRLTAGLESRVQAEVAAREVAQLRAAQAERLQALGQLAAGIAHDFNNVLQSVVAAAGLIERQPGDVAMARHWLSVVTEASARGAAVARRLLAFGRRGDLSPEPVDGAALLEEVREMLEQSLGPDTEVVVRIAPGLPRLLADRGQLETVLVNLVTNACEAMPGGGRLVLAAAPASAADRPEASAGGALAAGAYVRLSVADSGIGMDAVTLARATDPFFSTKGPGHGTGLGLSMARGFAEQSGGALDLSSRPGAGSTVTLWLPQAEPAPAAAPPPEQAPGCKLRVLLVDDEALLREVLAEFLEDWGCCVHAVESGAAALAVLDAGEAVDVLVTDLSMPGMDGLALIRAARQRRPGLPAILLTGYAGQAAPPVAESEYTLMHKPVSGTELVERITALTAARSPAA